MWSADSMAGDLLLEDALLNLIAFWISKLWNVEVSTNEKEPLLDL